MNIECGSEKRKMLLEAEENKMEMYEKEYEQVIADWKAGLPIRKQALEAEFARELDEVEAFYRKENAQLQQLSTTVSPSSSISSRQEIIVGPSTATIMSNSVP
ncbi:BMA-GCK-4, isoform e [Dirofilaria immitis]|nr:BMA-GCK-4, isoform e [Dirofilaria immitis]